MEEKKKKRTLPVFVLDKNGNPLMPTRRFGWVRRGIRDGKLKVVTIMPFTVQLCYDIENIVTQKMCAGVDIGHTHIGVSVTTKKDEVFALQVDLRKNIKENMHERAEYRHKRRYKGSSRPRKTDFNKPVGWLSPSMRYVVTIHENIIKRLLKLLPITNIILEKCKFDFQLMMNSNIIKNNY